MQIFLNSFLYLGYAIKRSKMPRLSECLYATIQRRFHVWFAYGMDPSWIENFTNLRACVQGGWS